MVIIIIVCYPQNIIQWSIFFSIVPFALTCNRIWRKSVVLLSIQRILKCPEDFVCYFCRRNCSQLTWYLLRIRRIRPPTLENDPCIVNWSPNNPGMMPGSQEASNCPKTNLTKQPTQASKKGANTFWISPNWQIWISMIRDLMDLKTVGKALNYGKRLGIIYPNRPSKVRCLYSTSSKPVSVPTRWWPFDSFSELVAPRLLSRA